jgi:hypothetical protein
LVYALQGFPSLQARVNLAPRTAVEVGTDFFLPGRISDGLEGMYRLQVRQLLGDGRRQLTPYVTGGIVGDFKYRAYPESGGTLPTGDTIVFPAHKEGWISSPLGIAGGGGVRARLAKHLFAEAGAQLWVFDLDTWVVTHFGLTVPLGPRR